VPRLKARQDVRQAAAAACRQSRDRCLPCSPRPGARLAAWSTVPAARGQLNERQPQQPSAQPVCCCA
jgi:hypothetical protein